MFSCFVVAPVHAQPIVRVRAETQLTFRTHRDREHVSIDGSLHDDLGEPLADREIALSVQEHSSTEIAIDSPHSLVQRLRTNERGDFRTVFTLPRGNWSISADFEGDEHHLRKQVLRDVSFDRAPVELEVDFEGEPIVDLDRPVHTLSVHAVSEAGAEGIEISISENHRTLARGRTDQHGVLQLTLRTSELGEPAVTRLTIRSESDEHRADAQIEVPIVRFRETSLTLRSSASEVELGSVIHLDGQLTTSVGGLDRKAIGLWAGELHLVTILTDERGEYHAGIDTRELGAFEGEIVARFESDAPFWGGSISAPIPIHVRSHGSTPWAWITASAALSALIVAFIGRKRPTFQQRHSELPQAASIQFSKRSSFIPESDHVAGRVIDAANDSGIASAKMKVLQTTLIAEVETDLDGNFALSALPPGTFALEISAPGYETLTHKVIIPHRGEWSSVCIRLQNLRTLVWEPLKPIAARLLPAPDLWGIWTGRELGSHARQRAPRTLSILIAHIERAAYAREKPTPADLEKIKKEAADLTATMDRSTDGASSPQHSPADRTKLRSSR